MLFLRFKRFFYGKTHFKFTNRYFKKYRDLTYIGIAAWYLISIIDANVDASLSDYDVGRNLTLSLRPESLPAYQGQMFALNFKLIKTF